MQVRDFATAFAVTGLAIAGSFGVASAAVRPPAHAVPCAGQLSVIRSAERGTAGARALDRIGQPELAATARAATSLAGARWYGVALEGAVTAIEAGRGQCGGGYGRVSGGDVMSRTRACRTTVTYIGWGRHGWLVRLPVPSVAEVCAVSVRRVPADW